MARGEQVKHKDGSEVGLVEARCWNGESFALNLVELQHPNPRVRAFKQPRVPPSLKWPLLLASHSVVQTNQLPGGRKSSRLEEPVPTARPQCILPTAARVTFLKQISPCPSFSEKPPAVSLHILNFLTGLWRHPPRPHPVPRFCSQASHVAD